MTDVEIAAHAVMHIDVDNPEDKSEEELEALVRETFEEHVDDDVELSLFELYADGRPLLEY